MILAVTALLPTLKCLVLTLMFQKLQCKKLCTHHVSYQSTALLELSIIALQMFVKYAQEVVLVATVTELVLLIVVLIAQIA